MRGCFRPSCRITKQEGLNPRTRPGCESHSAETKILEKEYAIRNSVIPEGVDDALPPIVFILGSPRSGTSVLFKTLASHPSFASTTNLTRRFRANFTLVRLAELFGGTHRPVEAGELWKSFWPDNRRVRDETDLTEHHRRMLAKIVRGHVRHFRREIFLAKRPDFSMRVR